LNTSLQLINRDHLELHDMAGKRSTAPFQVYVVLSGIYHGDATIQGVYFDGDAAEMASSNNHELVHVIPVNYNGVYVFLIPITVSIVTNVLSVTKPPTVTPMAKSPQRPNPRPSPQRLRRTPLARPPPESARRSPFLTVSQARLLV
jgi:hypothetical protein